MINILSKFADVAVEEPTFLNEINNFESSSMINGLIVLLAFCLISTIIIELALALIFGARKKNLGIIVLAQIITNPLVVLISNFILFKSNGSLSAYYVSMAILEICAFLTEGLIYYFFFTKNKNRRNLNPFFLSFLLNSISFLTGFIFLF